MNNNPKRHFDIDSAVSTGQLFTLLDAVQSNNQDDIDKLMDDSDMEFIAPEEMNLPTSKVIGVL